ncbi:AI-2E family transporter [Nocardioidaceae bacterium]|nr:AI-2E family transporter [Nocardioidaceae bacterium]
MTTQESEQAEDSFRARVRRAMRPPDRPSVVAARRAERRAEREAELEAERAAAREAADEAADERLAERLAERVATQWQSARERRAELNSPLPIVDGQTRTGRAEVPIALDTAAAWAWRLLLIAVAAGLTLWGIWVLRVVTVPVLIALLLAALLSPAVVLMRRLKLPKALAALLTVVGGLGLVSLMLTFVGRQIADGFSDLSAQVAAGIGEVDVWLRTGPLGLTDSQISDALAEVQRTLTDADVLDRATDLTLLVGHLLASAAILLLATYFFLADGGRIWSWLVRLFPGGSRVRVDRAGRVAWHSVTQFVRATVIVAAVDALGIMAVAALLDVPLVLALGVLVFLGAFVPVIGAFVTGVVAVLVALVAQGPVVALLMLAGVVVVQQVESHVLQPFLMGRFVAVHPLGVILAIGVGVLLAGIIGALLAVPLVAALNAVIVDFGHHREPDEPLPASGPLADAAD